VRLEGGRSGRLAGLLEATEQSGALARALAAEVTRTRGSWTSSRSAPSVELPSRQLAATARAVRPPTSAMPQPLPTPTSSTSCAPPAEAPLATAEPSQAAGEPALLAVSHEQRASAAAAPSSSSATSPTSPFIAAPLSTRTLPPTPLLLPPRRHPPPRRTSPASSPRSAPNLQLHPRRSLPPPSPPSRRRRRRRRRGSSRQSCGRLFRRRRSRPAPTGLPVNKASTRTIDCGSRSCARTPTGPAP